MITAQFLFNIDTYYQFENIFFCKVLTTEALIMWTSRFGILGSEESKQRLDELPQSKGYLELEILINDDDNETLGDGDPHGKIKKYKPYFTGKNNKRTTNSLNSRKVVMVHGDGRMSRKQVIR